MRSFRNLSIGGKIAAVILLLVGMEVIISVSGIYFLYEVNQSLREVVDIDGEKRALAMLIKTDLLEIHRAQKDLILADSKILVEAALADRARSLADLQTHLVGLEQLLGADKRKLIGNFRQDWEAFYMVDQEIETLVRKGVRTTPSISENRFGPTGVRVLNADAIGLSTNQSRSAYNKAVLAMDQIVKQMETTLKARLAESQGYFYFLVQLKFLMVIVAAVGGLLAGFLTARSISVNLGSVVRVTDAIAGGRLDTEVSVESGDETGHLADSVKRMQAGLIKAAQEFSERDWIKVGVARINDAIRGEVNLEGVCRQAITEIATYLEAPVGVLFLACGKEADSVLKPVAGFALTYGDNIERSFKIGEGLVGQAASTRETITVADMPEDHLKITSGVGQSQPVWIMLSPLLFKERLIGVAEIGVMKPVTDLQRNYLEQILPAVAVTIETVRSRERVAQALAHSQKLTLELQTQQNELRKINEELEEQTSRLMESQTKLRRQQEVIEAINVELEERNQYLEQQKQATEKANQELEQSRQALEEKARQLSRASQFKSEFLANISHELRTPLNSILLLARMLTENKEGNLGSEEVRSAEIIHKSGKDLLTLINEVLDLAKIESGRMEINLQQVNLQDLADNLNLQFQPIARNKEIELTIQIDSDCPDYFFTDCMRLEQILRNLISNAIKFTGKGEVVVRIGRPSENVLQWQEDGLREAIAFSVQDSGIGIAPEQHKQVFEAFRQLDSGTARKYGGTGLGLSISRELAQLLGGDIHLESQLGHGAVFTLLLPQSQSQITSHPLKSSIPAKDDAVIPLKRHFQDDRDHLKAGNSSILIIEDDPYFAEQLLDFCRQKKYKALVAPTGEEGLQLARMYLPKGIVLDLKLPGKNGWAVLEDLKANPDTRHIPVHILSAEKTSMRALEKGAVGFISKPVSVENLEAALDKLSDIHERSIKHLLIVEDDDQLRHGIIMLIDFIHVACDQAATAVEALQAIQAKNYDCMILDLELPDVSGLLKKMSNTDDIALPPVIVYTGRVLSSEEEADLRRFSQSIIIKNVRSEERLFDETALFLHWIVENMPECKRRLITDLYVGDRMFKDKKILVVDDDMRNAFALSILLKEKGMRVFKAENGNKALIILDENPDIDLVLIDIMMPVMDGYETIQQIRRQEGWRTLPIIALTAKAMPPDLERCIAAGANDYITKPFDNNRLFSMMRIWLHR